MGAGHSLIDADAADTTTTTDASPPLPEAAKKTAPEPQQPSGRKLRSSTRAQIAAALAKAVASPPPPPPPRRAPKLDSTKETVESAADAAEPASLLRQEWLQVVKRPRRTRTGWVRPNGKGEAEKEAIRFVKAVQCELWRMYQRYVASVKGKLNLNEETEQLVEGFFDSVEALFDAMSGLEGVRPTDDRVNNLVRGALHVKEMANALAENELTGCDFMLGLAACSAAARRGASPVDALAEFKAAIDVVVKKHANKDAYLLKTAAEGRNGRGKNGGNVIVNAKTTVATREADAERRRALASGERKPRYAGPTMATNALTVKTRVDDQKKLRRKAIARSKAARKAAGVATPQYCMPAGVRGDGTPLFITSSTFVPKGSDNRPRPAEEAAARALRHRAEKGGPTRAEIEADRRARLPDNVRPSSAKSRAGQYTVRFYVNRSYSLAIRRKFKEGFSVVKPGTDGYYASTTVAERVRDDWIEEGLPIEWLAKQKS